MTTIWCRCRFDHFSVLSFAATWYMTRKCCTVIICELPQNRNNVC